ncbi:MAG TPA: CYTH and CHAD domain-containing protein [Streptosporangiaceae bacterium]|nr:CYTH and CHAD domain-containing protein [Streptosporangiaceae bacterium]
MAVVVREVERKYDPGTADVAAAATGMRGLAGVASVTRQDEQLLDAVYYDTADLRLIRAGVTFRRRTGGDDEGWHLKLPAGADARDEIRLPLTRRAVPEELTALVRARTRAAKVAPVVQILTSRQVFRLLDSEGRTLAEIAADHVSAEPADGAGATSWNEVEAELVVGDPELLEAIDGRLRAAGMRAAATATKLERALGARLPAPQPPNPPPTARSPAGEVVLAYLRDQVTAMSHCDPLVRRNEPDAVHQMRVATRRARSALQAFGQIIDRDATRSLCAELKWLAATLGRVRDAEVLLTRFTAELSAIPRALVVGPVQARIRVHFATEYAEAHKAAVLALDGQRYLHVLDDMDALLASPPLTSLADSQAKKALARPVRRAKRRLERALAAVPGAEDRDVAIHEARKAAKRARYAAEAAVPALGDSADGQAAWARELQQLLGDHHDGVVARMVLLDLAEEARAAGEDTFSYGLMHQRQACQGAEIARKLPTA